ncbi:MAG: cytidine deaminase [Lachnospiraceae bacterium]|nr:cytidine deaminase [Lachnospiraceae bacterium]
MTREELCRLAIQGLSKSYAPYSGYYVSAALEDSEGNITTGCNIENASYTPTVCAERTAFFSAVAHRKGDTLPHFVRMAVVGGNHGEVTGAFPPCGVCRQVMSEFCDDSFEILVVQSVEPLTYDTFTLPALLPLRFGPSHLSKKGQ